MSTIRAAAGWRGTRSERKRNAIRLRRHRQPHARRNAHEGCVEYFEYNAFGQITAHVWPDYGGGRKRRDEFAYYTQGRSPALESRTLDAKGMALTTTFRYDALGRPIRKIDPKGADALCVWNALDQLVSQASRETLLGNGIRRQRNYTYDANDNLIAIDTSTLDEQGQVEAESSLSEMFEYDILNCLANRTQRGGGGQTIANEYAYDDNHNLSLIRLGEAASGRQPANTIVTIYDERDLPFRVIRAAGIRRNPRRSTTMTGTAGCGRSWRVSRTRRPM